MRSLYIAQSTVPQHQWLIMLHSQHMHDVIYIKYLCHKHNEMHFSVAVAWAWNALPASATYSMHLTTKSCYSRHPLKNTALLVITAYVRHYFLYTTPETFLQQCHFNLSMCNNNDKNSETYRGCTTSTWSRYLFLVSCHDIYTELSP